MLEKLFSSRVRVSLLSVFLSHPDRRFYGRELERITEEHQNAIWRELRSLSELGLLTAQAEGKMKYYLVNRHFPLYTELRALVFKATKGTGKGSRLSPVVKGTLATERKPYRPNLIVGEND